ncbi:MAG: tRNA (adenosine(37)-N6)-threonylcarbamoyltransferase complex dimerization subunit type 1 TsaB [Treponema sp.]
MKALAVDCSVTKFTVAAKHDDRIVSCSYDVGMRQSELLLPAMDYVLKTAGIPAAQLDYTAVCSGPGSFTGLRLAFSALKAIELSHGVPVYGVPTLDAYAYAYKNLPFAVLCVVDAKKDKFYAKADCGRDVIFPSGDYTPEEITGRLEGRNEILVCGSDGNLFCGAAEDALKNKIVHLMPFTSDVAHSLFALAEEYRCANVPPLAEYEGPLYIRASEAEEHLAKRAQA